MTVQTFYRCAVWLPLAIPALVATAVHRAGWDPSLSPVVKLVQLLLMSLAYGGLPYAALAAWATWWIDRRSEPEIRRRALQAPLWMVAAWLPFTAFLGGLAGRVEIFLGLAALGTLVILPLGYAYVALVFLLRRWLGRAGALLSSRAATPPPTVVGAWSDGHRTLRIAEDGSYSFMDPSGAITGYWQLDTSSGRLDLSPPLGSKISARVTENWTNIAVHLTIGSHPTLNYLLQRQ